MWTVGNGNTTPEVGIDFMKHLISLLFATSLVASEYHGTFFADTLTVTNTLYLGSDSEPSPEIRIPDGGILYFKNAANNTFFSVNASGAASFTGDLSAGGNADLGSNVHVSSTLDAFRIDSPDIYISGNTHLTAANYASLSVGSGVASGAYSFAANNGQASGQYSFASGGGTASGNYSFSANSGTASGPVSFACGGSSTASGFYAFTSGQLTTAAANASAAFGAYTYAGSDYGFVSGYYNTDGNGGLAHFVSGYQNSVADNLNRCTVMGSQAHALHDATFLWSDGTTLNSSTNNEFSIFASKSIRLLGSPVKLDVGIASLATNAVNGAASGWTNSTGVDTTVAVSGVAVGFTLYNNAGTPIYTNAAGSTTFYPRVQAFGKIIVTAGTAVTLRSLGY